MSNADSNKFKIRMKQRVLLEDQLTMWLKSAVTIGTLTSDRTRLQIISRLTFLYEYLLQKSTNLRAWKGCSDFVSGV